MADDTKPTETQQPHDMVKDNPPADDQDLASAGLFTGESIDEIPDAKVKEWKQKYKRLFVITHLGTPYVYRMIDYHEYKALRTEIFGILQGMPEDNNVNPDDVFKETALKKFVLWPENFKELLEDPTAKMADGLALPGGLPYILGEYLMASSGFMEVQPEVIE